MQKIHTISFLIRFRGLIWDWARDSWLIWARAQCSILIAYSIIIGHQNGLIVSNLAEVFIVIDLSDQA